MMRFRNTFLLCACLLLAACGVKRVDERGYRDAEAAWESIKAGASTRDDVLAALGTPSTESDYGEENWYYIRGDRESMAFLKPEITDQKVTRITFDAGGIVQQVRHYDLSQSKNVAIVGDITPTEGHKLGILEQVVGNLGRFNKAPPTPGPKRH